jgi:hypothetical protein
MSPGATRLRPAQEVSNETWIADATNGLLSMPSPLSFRERSLDAFKNGLMLIRLCGCGTVFTNLGSMLKRLFDRACQKDLAIWMVQRNLLSECEPAGVRIVGREHDFDLEIGSTQRSSVPHLDGRPWHRLFDEPIRQRLGRQRKLSLRNIL